MQCTEFVAHKPFATDLDNCIVVVYLLNMKTKLYSLLTFCLNTQGVPDLSDFGDAYDLEFGLGVDKPPTSAIVKKELQREIIYHMSPHEVR